MLPNLALLDHPLVVKPSTSIETLGDALQFLSTLSAEVRSKPHWYRAIHSIGIAILEPRYVTLATLNLQLWRWTIYLQANRPAKPRLSPRRPTGLAEVE